MTSGSALAGVARYEFAMQIRRPALWIGLALLCPLLFAASNAFIAQIGKVDYGQYGGRYSFTRSDVVVMAMTGVNLLLTLGAGLLLADRVRRDRSTHVDEIMRSTGASPLAHTLGKYAGAVAATLVPITLITVLGATLLALMWGDASVLPLAAAAFLALVVPPVLFVGAFAVACTSFIWTPLFQFLFVGYWFWTNLNPTDSIWNLNGTYLSPGETFVVPGFFGVLASKDGFYFPTPAWQGVLNIVVLLLAGAVALLVAWQIQARRWRPS
ncbi:MAG TPA: hypothetical protein VGI27_01290 [Solirubrobacteraceae bacterium]